MTWHFCRVKKQTASSILSGLLSADYADGGVENEVRMDCGWLSGRTRGLCWREKDPKLIARGHGGELASLPCTVMLARSCSSPLGVGVGIGVAPIRFHAGRLRPRTHVRGYMPPRN